MSIKNVVLAGAGGNLGTSLLLALQKEFNVTVLSRASSKTTFPSSVTVAKVTDGYPHAELVAAFKNQDAVVSTIAAATTELQKGLIDAAIEAGIKRFIPAEWGSDTADPNALEEVPIFQGKDDIRKHLQSKEGPDFSWTAIATGAFFDWCLKNGILHFDIQAKKALILGTGDVTWPTSTLAQIGLATTRALQHAEQTANRFLFVESFRVSQNQVLRSLEKAMGATWEVEKREPADLVAEAWKKVEEGDVLGIYDIVFANSVEGGEWESKGGFANELLGLEQADLDQEVKKVLEG